MIILVILQESFPCLPGVLGNLYWFHKPSKNPRGSGPRPRFRIEMMGCFYVLSREAMEPERPLGSRWSSLSLLERWNCGVRMESKILRVELVGKGVASNPILDFFVWLHFLLVFSLGFIHVYRYITLAIPCHPWRYADLSESVTFLWGKCSPLNLANLAWAFASAGWHGEMSTRRVLWLQVLDKGLKLPAQNGRAWGLSPAETIILWVGPTPPG